jgi:hypothetical protein
MPYSWPIQLLTIDSGLKGLAINTNLLRGRPVRDRMVVAFAATLILNLRDWLTFLSLKLEAIFKVLSVLNVSFLYD